MIDSALKPSNATLPAIAALGVPVPTYDRAALVPRILHIGVGGFHRSHMALYTDDLAHIGSDWGIRGVGLLESDRAMSHALQRQDFLYTLIERGSAASHVRVVGSIVGYELALDGAASLATLVAHPDTSIVSLTITEGGYASPATNRTLLGLAAALEARRAQSGAPLTVLSCDNLPGNGDVARAATIEAAETLGTELVRYLEEVCTFPNSMVDRITPQTSDTDRTWLRDEVGIDDAWPVVSEPFRQWVIEDDFAAGRPDYEQVGALLTDRVHDWELYKLRMLNASHSCMAYLMALAGVTYVDEAMALPVLRAYLTRFLSDEAIPTLRQIPGHPASDYAATVLERFENTGVRDQIARLCIDGTAKFPSFLIPTVERQLERGGPVDRAALALAGWARYLAVTPEAERAPDPHGARAVELAAHSLADPAAFLALDTVFTPPLQESARFRDAFTTASRRIAESGPLAAIA